METKTQKTFAETCCQGHGKKAKIVGIIIIAIIFLAILFAVAVAAKLKMHEELGGSQTAVSKPNVSTAMYPNPYPPYDDASQFVLPQDATRSGEITMQIQNADLVLKNISAVAISHGGTIYATYVSYNKDSGAKNGFEVAQVSEDQFESTYTDLKLLGSSIIRESTKKIPRYDYAVPMMSATGQETNSSTPAPSKVAPDTGSAVFSSDTLIAQPAPSIAPMPPIRSYPPQNKGYIKVVFVGNGENAFLGSANKTNELPLWMGYEGLGMKKNIWAVLAVKMIAVIAFIFIIIILTIRLIRHMRLKKAVRKKHTVHIVRQAPKTRSRVIRSSRKK